MTSLINDIQSMPLWFSIPLGVIYLALLAYFVYILWHYRRKNTLALVLTIAALAMGQKAHAESTFTVSNVSNSNTFTIKRSETGYAQKVLYHTVGLTAYAGQHFTAVSGVLEFLADDDTKTVTVNELTPSGAYAFQNGTSRSYKLEVTDRAGNLLDYATRNMTTGTSVTNSGVFNEKSVTINSGEYTADDDGYMANGYKSVAASNYCTSGTQAYLGFLGAKLHMTLSFDAKENDDGYQYLQLLVDNTSSCDLRDNASNGDPGNNGTPNLSLYMAGFEILSGSLDNSYKSYTFPVTSVGSGSGATNPWGHGTTGNNYPLDQQRFKSGYRATDGKLIIPTNFSSLVLRLNASGKEGSDEWAVKNVTAHIQAIDPSAPTKSAVSVNPGRHAKGNTVYVSVAYSEIVTISGSTKKLTTSWGDLSYEAGSGTNVLTFKGKISDSASRTLSITGLTGTVQDLAGKSFTWSGTETLSTTLDDDLAYAITDFQTDDSGNYLITCHDDLRGLAGFVNGGGETIGLTFLQMTDLVFPYTTNWNNASSEENNFTAIGDYNHPFRGTFDGQGNTVSGIRIYKAGTTNADNYQGLFGRTLGATIKNVTLADARITGKQNVGGIAGYITDNSGQGGIVENCRVGSDVTIHAVAEYAYNHGGVVGQCNGGTIRGCVSAATLTVANDLNVNEISHYGGIVGSLNGDMSDCLALGVAVPDVSNRGAIVGHGRTTTNCYYLNCTVAGTSESNLYAITLPANASVVRSGTDLPGTNNRTYDNGADIDGVPYTCASSELTLSYNIAALTGYTVAISAAETTNGNDVAVTDNGDYTYTISSMPAAAITVTATPTNVWGVSADIDGTSAEKAYTISDTRGLNLLATLVNGGNEFSGKFFKLVNTITYDHTTAWDDATSEENNFTAIGGYYNGGNKYFCGTFDGQGNTVSGIRIYKAGTTGADSYQGLFGGTLGATIKNVVLADARITGKQYVGGIAGYITANGGQLGIVENCCVGSDVTIHAVAEYAYSHGGVVGDCNGGTILGCVSAATLTVANDLNVNEIMHYGGIVGWLNGDMSDCLALGASVPAVNVNGAIAVAVNTSKGTHTNNYHHSCTVGGNAAPSDDYNVSAYTISAGTDVTLTPAGSADATYEYDGIKRYGNALYYNGVLYAPNSANVSLTLGYTGSFPAGFAVGYVATAGTISGTDNPYTLTMPAEDVTINATPIDVWDVNKGCDGTTAEKAYAISDTRGLNLLATLVNGGNEFSGKFFKLVYTITYDHTTAWDDATSEENNFTAIGGYYNGGNKYFCGTFDGQGNTVSGIRIYKAGTTGADSYQGLFGETWDATIKNVILADARITGKQNVGGIAGYITDNNGQGGIVENCRVGSDVTIHAVAEYANYHGGVVGQCNGGTILGCVSAATLTVADGLTDIYYYGGIVGRLNGNMSDCLALGASVPAVNVNGAIAGTVDTNWGTPTNCYYHSCTVSANTDQSDAYTISAGTDITVAPAGDADATYDYDGIQHFGSALYYGGVLYAPEAADISLTLGTTIPEETFNGYAATAGTLTGTSNPYTLTMPDEDVTIIEKPTITYIDENGKEQICRNFSAIGERTEELTSGWYAALGDVKNNNRISINGDVKIILKDGVNLIINGGIKVFSDNSLTIYGQANGTGKLTTGGWDQYASIGGNQLYESNQNAGNITINGGVVEAGGVIGSHDGSCAVTINGGTVSAYGLGSIYYTNPYANPGTVIINGGNVTLNGDGQLYTSIGAATVTINGGTVSAEGSIVAGMSVNDGTPTYSGAINLGWTNSTDRIKAGSYGCATLKVKSSQVLYDGTTAYEGTLDAAQLAALAGKTLEPYNATPFFIDGTAILLDDDSAQPDGYKNADRIAALADGQPHDVMLLGRTLYRDGDWNTLCLPFTVDGYNNSANKLFYNAAIMKFDYSYWYDTNGKMFDTNTDGSHRSGEVENGSLYLNFNVGKNNYIEAGHPYIVKWPDTELDNVEDPVFQGVTVTRTTPSYYTTEEGYNAQTGLGNVTFRGTYSPIDYTEDNHSILFLGTNNTLYYPKAGAHIGAFRCYFELGNGLTAGEPNSAVRGFNLNFDGDSSEATIISPAEIKEIKERADAWYSINGVKLDSKPTQKGLYLHGGRKTVIK